MFKKLLFSVFLLSIFSVFAQDNWKSTKAAASDDVVFVKSHMPFQYQLFNIDLSQIKNTLKNVESKGEMNVNASSTILNFPNENGKMEQYKMLEWSIFEDELADKFDMIHTYIGQNVHNPSKSLTMSIGTDGLHVMFFRPGKSTLLIDPYTRDRSKYIVYTSNNLPAVSGEFLCEFKNDDEPLYNFDVNGIVQRPQDGKLRSYRLAVACTIEYSQYHLNNQGISGGASLAVKKAAVLSAITNTINRVAGVYRLELGIDFNLVGNEDSIIFINSDSFSNDDAGALIGQSQTQITNLIGSANFDVGHTFSTGGGGLASLGSICYVNAKARGITGSSQPIGDFYDIDYVAHEMGHQFGANHTFNTNTSTNNCGAQRNSATAGEPGGGSTIMAYAGICGATPNVQNNSDAYFHYFSLLEINNRITSSPTCAALINSGNIEPTANAGSNYTIPKGTAFILEGQSTDANGDTVLYSWEQIDTALAQEPLVSTSTSGPAYRSLFFNESPKRYMPKFSTVLGGSLQSQWEVTPTVARQLNFALTTRDYNVNGGQTNSDQMSLTVSGAAGPFIVTSQTSSETWNTGESKTITWNVAGTTANGVNVATVKIILVGSNGEELAVLASSATNDGSETVTVPSITNDNARVMVKGNGNVFYAINSTALGINTEAICTSLCSSSGTSQYATGTTLVNFNTINNSTGKPSGYSDYTNISTTVTKNNSYDLTVNVNTDGTGYRVETKVWIDWNRDCDFDDTGEEYDLGNATSVANGATSLSPLSITVPSSASLGSTIMRVSSKYNTDPTACAINFDGEVEDYTIVIDNGAAINDLLNFDDFVLSPNPNNGHFNIKLKSENNNVSIIIFDLLGRQIFSKKYLNNQTEFNKNIDLNNIESGIYLVNVTDGIRFNSEKIIIK